MLSKFECNRVKPFRGPGKMRRDLLACYWDPGFKKAQTARESWGAPFDGKGRLDVHFTTVGTFFHLFLTSEF